MTMSKNFPDKTWADHFAEVAQQEAKDGDDNE